MGSDKQGKKFKSLQNPRELIDPTEGMIADPEKMTGFMDMVFIRLADDGLAAYPELNKMSVTRNSNAPICIYILPQLRKLRVSYLV